MIIVICILSYLIQLILCYFMIRQMYIWDDDFTPVGMLIFFAFIPVCGFVAELSMFLMDYFAEREYKHDWDKIWSKFLRIKN